jgi:hypothetical protein
MIQAFEDHLISDAFAGCAKTWGHGNSVQQYKTMILPTELQYCILTTQGA